MAPRSFLNPKRNPRSALILYTSDEPRFYKDTKMLSKALKGLGIKVITCDLITEGEMPLIRFLDWVNNHDGKGHQLILAYFGHGGVDNGRLMTSGLDLTSLQEHLRDYCDAQALAMMGTCRGGNPLGAVPSNSKAHGDRVVETLAPCNGKTLARTRAWLKRIVWQLKGIEPGDTMLARQIAAAVGRHKYKGQVGRMRYLGCRGFYRKESGEGSIQLVNKLK
ncbi:hypothetical protein LTR17_001754 [Elasticomyces elasticus]|nr:hypothetical protein LTR17_001754 [Elasticomyces elasticus]